ncbi:hypothetical protein IFM51744_02363 [Aspergillus udagawae]|nr:hypothetical protein IFM51744_02363 [Aspergillus udagawae]
MKGPLFYVAFQFPDLKTAATLMALWATSALLRRGWNALYEDLRQASFIGTVVVPRDVTSVVTEVCQSAEFCLNETNLMFGVFVASMPLAICKAVLQRDGHHDWRVAWVTGVLETLQHRGVQIVKYQCSSLIATVKPPWNTIEPVMKNGPAKYDAFITPSAALSPATPKNLTSASLGPAYTMLADRSEVSIALIGLYLPVVALSATLLCYRHSSPRMA